ncbi:MAG: hypothetical protein KAR05_03130 [Candidatus Omnitrophica bacterium]|nr:hypothetical protein [Candidatus Omnitrophota bacterium]
MEKDFQQELINQLEVLNKKMEKIADCMAVFKISMIAMIIALLIVIIGNYLP